MVDDIEYNEVNHVGVKPAVDMDSIRTYSHIPDFASQVVTYQSANNNTTILWTVTAGKTLYMTTYTLQALNYSASNATGYLAIRNASDTIQYVIARQYLKADTDGNDSLNLSPPLEIATGWDVFMYSDTVNMQTQVWIHGFEI